MKSLALASLFLFRVFFFGSEPLFSQSQQQAATAAHNNTAEDSPQSFQQKTAPGRNPYQSASVYGYDDASAGNYIAVGSTYIPMDSWIYPALDRLSALGYLDTAFFGLRPWTRMSIAHMLDETSDKLQSDTGNEEASVIYAAVRKELAGDETSGSAHAEVDTLYARGMQIMGGRPLTDSFHFGQTIINDYGRPYAQGFNAVAGVSARAEAGRMTLSFRGEYQHAPNVPALPLVVQRLESAADFGIPLPTSTATGTRDQFRLIDANLSYHLLGHEISVGKSEMWQGPGQGSAMIYSTNSEPIYMFRINRIEPLWVPLLSRLTGPIRYDNFFGDLKGHRSPNRPWIFGNKISIHPTRDIEFGFSRTVEFAGKGYYGLTFGHFYKSFFSVTSPLGNGYDPGDRRANFDFRWRLPFLEKSVTLYADSIADDDPSPLANFRRSGWRPGIYISHLPGARRLDLRLEAPYTNQAHNAGISYTNGRYKDGYTNKGFLIGDWIGRDSTGYQGWLTYWLSPSEQIQLQYRDSKIDKALWPGGGTQTDVGAKVVKRLTEDVELNGSVQFERWLIPTLDRRKQSNTTASFQLTWFPKWAANR